MLANLLPTIVNGVVRAFKINTSEVTPDENVNDAIAKGIKILVRLILVIVLLKFFPEQWQQLFQLIVAAG